MPGFTRHMLRNQRSEPHHDLDRALLKRLNLTPSELTPQAIGKIWRACAEDEKFFLYNFVRTKDQSQASSASVREFREEPYITAIIDAIHRDPKPILIDKARRLRVTWTLCGHCVWRAKFHKNRLSVLQSKRREDAWNLVYYKDWSNGRCSFIESNLPIWMQTETVEAVSGALFYPTGSKIWGIPQGKHTIRGEGPTDFILDECAFWESFVDSYTAALSLVGDGCCVIAVTTAYAGSPFAQLIGVEEDEDKEEEEEEIFV